MSERQSNPESNPEKQRRLTDNCDNCNQDYELTPENTELYYYITQDDCTHLLCTCPNCNYKTRIFIGDETFGQAVENGIEPIVKKNAPQGIYEKWLELNGVQLPPTYELTNRHEATVRKFGDALLAIPDELFWDNIEAETDRPHPQKWID